MTMSPTATTATTPTTTKEGHRMEHDLIGDVAIPMDAHYGIQTHRAMQNFDLTGVAISHFPELINSLAMVKKAAALANHQLGNLDTHKRDAIVAACDEVIAGQWHDHFLVDLIQGGAGTSSNMAANEVIANRGLELLGRKKGEYTYLHPNNDVNMSQSTNDVYPTAARLAIVFSDDPFIEAVKGLIQALDEKSNEFKNVIKLGRTQLQDAVPMTLGQEFKGWSITLQKDLDRMDEMADLFSDVNLGGTAIGTGINTDPEYAAIVIEKLQQVTGINVRLASNLVEATSDMGEFLSFSSLLKRIAVKLSKIANDLRLLSSGPRGGLNDVNLPAVQPGSSIMPGKVNPVMCEAVNQTAFQVIGNDLTVTMAAEAGQLQLNAFEPVIMYNILSSLRMLTRCTNAFTEKCVRGITANVQHCEDTSTAIARKALHDNKNIIDLIREEGLLTEKKIEMILRQENLTGPSSLLREDKIEDFDKSYTHMRAPSTVPLDELF